MFLLTPPLISTHVNTVKPEYSSGLGRTGTVGSRLTTCLPKSTTRSISLWGSQMDMHRVCFSSTMHLATRSVRTTQFQLGGWSKVRAQAVIPQMLYSHCPPAPKEGWTHRTGGARMRSGTLPTGKSQSFYFPEDHPSMPGWFKGMEQILRERDLWPKVGPGLPAQCPDFKCPPGRVDCCCRRVLFLQPDFIAQKSQLEELIESRGHICDFYPKYHCELNFIEQYWGAAKTRYRVAPRAKTTRDMEKAVRDSLDSVPLLQIRR
jgi:hypothetical protein